MKKNNSFQRLQRWKFKVSILQISKNIDDIFYGRTKVFISRF
jgi:hypothetical protein